jgi:hypothetical protein
LTRTVREDDGRNALNRTVFYGGGCVCCSSCFGLACVFRNKPRVFISTQISVTGLQPSSSSLCNVLCLEHESFTLLFCLGEQKSLELYRPSSLERFLFCLCLPPKFANESRVDDIIHNIQYVVFAVSRSLVVPLAKTRSILCVRQNFS